MLCLLALACVASDRPVAPSAPQIAQQVTAVRAVGDGCARLHIKIGPGSAAAVSTIDNGSACRADELEVRVDSAPLFDASTGVLRLAIVIRNLGTIAMGTPARLTFIADSAHLFDNDGNLLPGKPDIVAHNADSANASRRIGVWRYDAHLGPNPQALGPGATSQRRWLEFHSSDWKNAIRISLSASAMEPNPNVVPALPPEQIPKALMDSLGWITFADGDSVIPELLGVSFKLGTPQAQRQAAIDAVGGIVVGGRREPDAHGTYYVRAPANRSVSRLLDAIEVLQALPQISIAEPLQRRSPFEPLYRRPNDGAGFERHKWNVRYKDAADTNWALERISAPLAWGCSVGSTVTRVAVIDDAYRRGSELDTNIVFYGGLPDHLVFDPFNTNHGLGVASLFAAPADNNRGIAGVMWRAAMDLRDVQANPANLSESVFSWAPLTKPECWRTTSVEPGRLVLGN